MSKYVKNVQAMKSASYLLPAPCGEVVRELLDDYTDLLNRYNALLETTNGLRDALRLINSGDYEDKPHSVAGYALHLWEKELVALEEK